ncbi:protein of unknown function [Niabella drilacis]|uniref:DUF4369 domain-containing protein n=2 Tax=Niabella drilacis (strain DSM 25811 / CCM 8410 / CCUG 62505 / LMG 26954 / E90) TaxID=1285928 RepID=A0A1G7C3J1_NIADE|nr:protein of unknown function [Niabella drilacis]
MDSTQIINTKFTFKGFLSSNKKYQSVGITTPDFKNITIFWIESGFIHFTAENGKFRDAVIKGSSPEKSTLAVSDIGYRVNAEKYSTYSCLKKGVLTFLRDL